MVVYESGFQTLGHKSHMGELLKLQVAELLEIKLV